MNGVEAERGVFRIARGPLVVKGWAVDSCTAATPRLCGGVYLLLDGRLWPTRYRTRRVDVAAALNREDLVASGFEGVIPVQYVGTGTLPVKVIVLSSDRSGHCTSEATYSIVVG